MEQINLDCLILIFNIFEYDKKSLHSCLLVNKKWCNIVVPILWRKYALQSINEKHCNVLLSFLPYSSKKLLLDNDIKLPSSTLSKFPSFNYISFCRFIYSGNIYRIIDIVQCKNVKYLSWETRQPLTLFPRASIFFSQLHHLCIDIDFANSDAFYELANICKDLNSLSVRSCSHNLSGLIYLIDAQRNLKELNLNIEVDEKTGKELSKALVRNGTTINILCLNSIDNIVLSSFAKLDNLKKLKINCWKNHKEIQDLVNYRFPNLQYLELYSHLPSYKEISLLIEKVINISEIYIVNTNKTAKETGILIKAIADNYPKINLLYTFIEPKDFIHVKTLLLNCRFLKTIGLESLEYSMNKNDNNIGDELLNIFILFSSKFLDEIFISGLWKYSINTFIQFFESFRGRSLYYFGIIDGNNYITDDHKSIIKKYIDEGVVRLTYES
ncbi:hypothetical protein C1646_765731 [Rhizophagus diaphanus]|nr:hypothetical protein C1646_765731 [Rhizophagus diaphanus] [Rhizophagus sp. MUCL 43196]